MSKELTLSTPIDAHGEELSSLTFRELTTEDIMRCGYPYAFKGAGNDMLTEINTAIVAKYISRLAGIPESSVKKMSTADFQAALTVVMSFLGGSTPGAES